MTLGVPDDSPVPDGVFPPPGAGRKLTPEALDLHGVR